MFLDHLRNARFDETCVMESFDVNSLYTNVSNDSAMQAVLELLTEHHESIQLHGLSIADVMALVKECLSCTVFRWSGNYFAQSRGLAMGQRLAPVLAIAFMAKIEAPILESRPLLYCRYIDDCFVICSTQNEMDRLFEMMNQQSEHIKLTRETPKQDWLPFLNVQIRISGGNLRTKWYRKPSNKNIIVHCSSAHPAQTKRAIVGNMFRTAVRVCSGSEEKHNSLGLATTIAISNGYAPERPHGWQRSKQTRKEHTNDKNKVQFCMPFISDEVSRATRLCLRRADLEDLVTIVEIPPRNLKYQLVRNRIYDRLCTTPNCTICPFGREGDCMKSCVIYMIKCRDCGDEYIGETARPLCVRVKEHLEGKSSSRTSTPLGCHRMRVHDGVDYEVETTILQLETEISARKTLEAFWIHVKNPKMNRKEECPTITNELLPLILLTSFDAFGRLTTPPHFCGGLTEVSALNHDTKPLLRLLHEAHLPPGRA
ncbi:hypothetical protein Y032_0017g3171 [Ancylostoma ceylanicum]|uniref:Reverse transcriptase domain-containing protein n=1 Tax=Ancylostoma ceylanicum TaxID=53326 RepID=A0A016V3A9_9BILA|nr:hypothetical protein Y032_0017g3171 [Ancylostoma ceylanicum]